jgi:hypothetical protein
MLTTHSHDSNVIDAVAQWRAPLLFNFAPLPFRRRNEAVRRAHTSTRRETAFNLDTLPHPQSLRTPAAQELVPHYSPAVTLLSMKDFDVRVVFEQRR